MYIHMCVCVYIYTHHIKNRGDSSKHYSFFIFILYFFRHTLQHVRS